MKLGFLAGKNGTVHINFPIITRVRTCIQCFLLIRTLLQDLRYGNAKVSTCSTSSRKLCGIPFLMPLERNYFSMLLLRMFVFGRDLFIVESFSICIINHTLILYDLVDSQSSFPPSIFRNVLFIVTLFCHCSQEGGASSVNNGANNPISRHFVPLPLVLVNDIFNIK